MNILIIPTNDWIRAPGHGHIDYIAEKLAAKGHKVYAWYFDLYRNERAKRKPQRVKLIRPKTLWLQDAALFFFLNALVQAPAMLKTIRDKKINVIINENIFSGFVAFLVSDSSVLKVFDYSDYFPESASIYYEKVSPTTKVMKKIVEKITLAITVLNIKSADICLSVCRSLMNDAHTAAKNKPCFFLPNTADTQKHLQLLNQRKKNPKLERPGPILVIMGVLDRWLDLITPLQALRTLKQEFPNIKLIVIGPWRSDEFKLQIEHFIKNEDLSCSVVIKGYVSDQNLAEYLSSASLCIMPYRTDNFSSIIRLPEKLFVYSAYGKPILSTPLPEVMLLKPEHVFFFHNTAEFVSKAETILSQENYRKELLIQASEFAQKYDINVLTDRLEQILLDNLPKK